MLKIHPTTSVSGFTSGLFLLLAIASLASTMPTQAFEVASIKSSTNRTLPRFACHGIDGHSESNAFRGMAPSASGPVQVPQGRCAGDIDLIHLVEFAYRTPSEGGPAWAALEQFRIEAKAEEI